MFISLHPFEMPTAESSTCLQQRSSCMQTRTPPSPHCCSPLRVPGTPPGEVLLVLRPPSVLVPTSACTTIGLLALSPAATLCNAPQGPSGLPGPSSQTWAVRAEQPRCMPCAWQPSRQHSQLTAVLRGAKPTLWPALPGPDTSTHGSYHPGRPSPRSARRWHRSRSTCSASGHWRASVPESHR